jgi:ADP-L-glycero-D-manno-heptose 6-epimerase
MGYFAFSEESIVRVLVTGAAGFIGSNLAIHLASAGHDVVGVDDFSSALWTNLIPFRGDLRILDVAHDRAALAAIPPCEIVFHQASITDTTVMDQKHMMDNNVEGFRNVLDAAAEWGSRVIWASSASTYGQGPPPMKESAEPQPLNVYAFSKLSMEHLANHYRQKFSHPLIGLRYFNVYGPGEDHKGKFASMIHQLAKQMRAGKRPRVFTAGQQKRDFVYVDDVIQANVRAITAKHGGVFNVGSGGAYSFNQVISELNRVLEINLSPDYFENPYSFTQDWTEADLTESRRALGYEPLFDLTRGIDAYFNSGKLGV